MSGQSESTETTETTETTERPEETAERPEEGASIGPHPDERERPAGRRSPQGIRIDPHVEATHEPRRTTISALVRHEPGVLAEVSGLVSRRQFNIESLTVGSTTNPETARITLVIDEPEPGVRQVERQLAKLRPVVSVGELDADAVRRELVVLKVHGDRPEAVHAVTEMYGGTTLDAGPRTITVEITGDEQTIDDAIDAFSQFGIRELARTGHTALARGETWTTPDEQERYEQLHGESGTNQRLMTDGDSTATPTSATTDDRLPNHDNE